MVFIASEVAGLIKPGNAGAGLETRPWANQRRRGVREPALKPRGRGEGSRRICQGFKPNPGNLAVRDYRGASGNAAMVELCTHLAIERARLVTSHLKLARLISIPTLMAARM